MLKYPIDDETGCGCNVKLGVSVVLVNTIGQQQGDIWAVDDRDRDGTSEELKTQIKVSGELHAEVLWCAGSEQVFGYWSERALDGER